MFIYSSAICWKGCFSSLLFPCTSVKNQLAVFAWVCCMFSVVSLVCGSVSYHTVLIPVALELKIGHFILFFSPHYFGYSSSFAFPYKFENKLVYIVRKLWDSDRNCVEFIYFFKSFIKEKNPLPCPSPSHPTGSSQCTSPEHPVSCIEPGLETCFTWKYTCFNAILSNHPTLAHSHSVLKTVEFKNQFEGVSWWSSDWDLVVSLP